jgi:glycosyltransferase involved in cell wall biosynthesis
MTRKITPFRDLYSLLCIIVIILRFKPEIVHTHTPKAGLLGMMASWVCGVRLRMHTVAGLPLMEARGWRRPLLKFAERVTYGCAHRVYPNSEGLRKYILQEFGITDDQKKFHVIGYGSSNGIDTSHFAVTKELEQRALAVRNELNIVPGQLVFAFVGRIVKDKGIVELAEAFHTVRHQINSKLILIGPFEDELDPLPSEMRVFFEQDPYVHCIGFQEDVRPWMKAADIFVFPSYREGFPNVVLQAACLEIPCIVSDINGCNEIITDGLNGVVVPPRDAGALASAMLTLGQDDLKRRELGKRARQSVVQHFERSVFWQGLLKTYRDLL